jgi:hypothetical protein
MPNARGFDPQHWIPATRNILFTLRPRECLDCFCQVVLRVGGGDLGREQVSGTKSDYTIYDNGNHTHNVANETLTVDVWQNPAHDAAGNMTTIPLPKDLSWLTLTHTQRWNAHRHSTGSGHVY